MDSAGKMNPSSFIPFCAFGKNMSKMGAYNEYFNLSVCDKFRPTVLDGQLCYKVDVMLLDDVEVGIGIETGLTFLMDYNTERMVWDSNHILGGNDDISLQNMILEDNSEVGATLYIETLGRPNKINTVRTSLSLIG